MRIIAKTLHPGSHWPLPPMTKDVWVPMVSAPGVPVTVWLWIAEDGSHCSRCGLVHEGCKWGSDNGRGYGI